MCYTEIPCGHSGISRGAEPGCWHLSEEFTALFSARSPPKNKICACDGIGRHARFRFSCSNACGFESLQAHHVVADFISFATTFYFKKSSLIHSVAPPFQIEPASLGFDLVCALRAQVGLRRESGRTPARPPRRPEQEKSFFLHSQKARNLKDYRLFLLFRDLSSYIRQHPALLSLKVQKLPDKRAAAVRAHSHSFLRLCGCSCFMSC